MPEQPRWRRYLRFWRSNVASDINDELTFHIQERVDDLIARGMHPLAARDEALRRLGDVEQVSETCRALAEEQEGVRKRSEWLSELTQDVTYALRVMRAHASLSAAIVLTVALGIGATTAIFSVVNAVLLQPLPYTHSERIVTLRETLGESKGSISTGHFYDWTEQSSSFAATAAMQGRTFNLTDGEPARYSGARVTPGYFDVLHMPPAVGRYFLPNETDASRVTVLSHELWQTRFNADSSIIGREITLSGEKHTVVGVTPAHFALARFDPRLWTILTFPPERRTNYGSHTFQSIGLLEPGVTVDQAQADLARITEGIRARFPDMMKDRGVAVDSYRDVRLGDYDTPLWILLGAVTFVLLIGCVNVASLLLARATARRKEIAIRGALGGGRVRLVRQLLTESLLLAVVGGGLGLVVARLGLRFLVGMGPDGVPRLAEAGLHLDVLAFALAITILCGVLFGLAPALRATRVELQSELRDGGRGSRGVIRDRVRASLIVAEVAVALVLLVSAALFLRSAHQLQQVALGFEPSGVTMLRVALPADRYDSVATIHRAFARIAEEMRSIPGVQSAGAGTRVPMWGSSFDFSMFVQSRLAEGENFFGHMRIVTPGYFETVGIPLKRGRTFRESDQVDGAPPVAVVNEAFAKRNFGSTDPIGQRVSGWTMGPEPEWREIVGVIGDVRAFGQDQEVPWEIYYPTSQARTPYWNSLQRSMTFVVKTQPGVVVAPAMRAKLQQFDAQLPAYDVQTMDDVLAQSTATRRFNTMLLSLLGLTGLLLAAIGIYGVIAFFVSQRTHEIGVRVALGATTANVVGVVLRQALVLTIAGIVIGGVAALWATSVLQSMLFEVKAKDPIAFAAGAGVLLIVALAAALLPARRAARVDPVRALTHA
ncbi:MAG: ADOP family duplicated permease [Gemmatimonadaceae bacterium]